MSEILIIEDEHALAAALEAITANMGHTVKLAPTGRYGLALLSKRTELVVLDIGLPDMSGLEVLEQIRQRPSPPPVLIITAHGVLENALAAKSQGASGYLVKPLDLTIFQETVHSLLQSAQPSPKPADASTQVNQLIGTSVAMQPAFLAIARACASDRPVLITGPTGSGKSLAAHVIHEKSPSPLPPFTTLHGSQATPAQLHEAGSSRNFVFIKNVEALSPPARVALSEELEKNTPSVRWVASTSANLPELMRTGQFPESLFYLLRIHEIRLPHLSERLDDLSALADYWFARSQQGGRWELTRDALRLLQAHDWPGNVREFFGVLDRAMAASPGSVIQAAHLPAEFRPSPEKARGKLAAALATFAADAVQSKRTYDAALQELESLFLHRLLEHFDGKPTHLAQAMEMNRVTLRKKLASSNHRPE